MNLFVLSLLNRIVQFVHSYYVVIIQVGRVYQNFTLRRFPLAIPLCLLSNAINGSLTVYQNTTGKGVRQYWLHSLVSVILQGFGGGILAPVLLGRPAMLLTNDWILPLCVVSWYTIHHLPGTARFLASTPVRFVWTAFLAVFRSNSVANIVQVAYSSIQAPSYYPIPLFGPILAGTLMGSLGSFMPFDKGLSPIAKFTPWTIQAAFLSAVFYHLALNDSTGPLGEFVRAFTGPLTQTDAVTLVTTFQLVALELQVLFHKDANLLTPFHKVAYLVTQVQGPLSEKSIAPTDSSSNYVGWSFLLRIRLAKFIHSLRILVLVMTLLLHILWMVPAPSLPAISTRSDATSLTNSNAILEIVHARPVTVLPLASEWGLWFLSDIRSSASSYLLSSSRAIGSCQWLGKIAGCQPFLMVLEELTILPEEPLPTSDIPDNLRYVYASLQGALPASTASLDRGSQAPYRLAVYQMKYDGLVGFKRSFLPSHGRPHSLPDMESPIWSLNIYLSEASLASIYARQELSRPKPSLLLSEDSGVQLVLPVGHNHGNVTSVDEDSLELEVLWSLPWDHLQPSPPHSTAGEAPRFHSLSLDALTGKPFLQDQQHQAYFLN